MRICIYIIEKANSLSLSRPLNSSRERASKGSYHVQHTEREREALGIHFMSVASHTYTRARCHRRITQRWSRASALLLLPSDGALNLAGATQRARLIGRTRFSACLHTYSRRAFRFDLSRPRDYIVYTYLYVCDNFYSIFRE